MLLAASRSATFSLIGISQGYVTAGQPAYFADDGKPGNRIDGFCGQRPAYAGFLLRRDTFYYLLNKSGIVPRGLSLWGLITVFPCLVGTLCAVFGYQVPFFVYLPYAPF